MILFTQGIKIILVTQFYRGYWRFPNKTPACLFLALKKENMTTDIFISILHVNGKRLTMLKVFTKVTTTLD